MRSLRWRADGGLIRAGFAAVAAAGLLLACGGTAVAAPTGSGGTAYAWGYNGYGQLGDGTQRTRPTPAPVHGLSGVVAVAGGLEFSLALRADGTVWAWGHNDDGQLGDGTFRTHTLPAPVHGLTGVTAIAAGARHGLALCRDGSVWAWGYNNDGEVGDGTFRTRTLPVRVHGLTGVTAIAAAVFHSVAITADASAWTWGSDYYGELGDGRYNVVNPSAHRQPAFGHVRQLAGGFDFTLAVRSDGHVEAVGENNTGQLGAGMISHYRTTVAPVVNLSDATAVSCGEYHAYALRANGQVVAWGRNDAGQLGDGHTGGSRAVPVTVRTGSGQPLTGIAALATGGDGDYGLALRADHTAVSWGGTTRATSATARSTRTCSPTPRQSSSCGTSSRWPPAPPTPSPSPGECRTKVEKGTITRFGSCEPSPLRDRGPSPDESRCMTKAIVPVTRTSVAAALAIATAVVVAPIAAHAMVIAKCAPGGAFAGRARVDPIAQRGNPVSMHSHDFYGNKALLRLPDRDRASFAELVGKPTTCSELPTDSAAYWQPTLLVAGKPLTAYRMEAYYRSWRHGVNDPTGSTLPLPADTRMIAGNAMASSRAAMDTRHVFWSCGQFSSKPGTRYHFTDPGAADCATASGQVFLTLAVNFPSCWDGRLNDHTRTGNTADYDGDPTSGVINHFAYPSGIRLRCPAGFSRKVTELSENISFDYRGNGTNVALSSGPGWTAHADFLDAWPTSVMKRMIATCVDTTANETTLHTTDKSVCGPPLHEK